MSAVPVFRVSKVSSRGRDNTYFLMANMLNEKLELPGMRVDVRPRDLKNTNGWRKAPWSQILSIRTDDGSRFFEWMVKSRYKMIDLIRFGFDCRIRDQTIELVSRFLSDR